MASSSNCVYDVIVVGCGASGVAALSRLYQNGLKVIGLEASDRIGGRIHSIPYGRGLIDLGAEWCHGEKDNVVFESVKDLNILASPKGMYDVVFYQSSGERLCPEIVNKYMMIWAQACLINSEKMANSKQSLGWHSSDEFWNIIKTSYPECDPNMACQMLDWLHKYENSLNASDNWFEASGRGHLEYWECEGNPQLNWNGRGYRTIIDVLLKKFPNPSTELPVPILLDKEVITIDWNTDNNNHVKVSCKDGVIYYSKHVIITLSIGVLKERHLNMFFPKLPVDKSNSICGMTLGTVDKIFLGFDKPWWENESKWFGFLWKHGDKEYFKNEDAWLVEVFGFNSSEHNPNILCGWVSGPAARLMETLPLEKVEDGLYRLLRYFMSSYAEIPRPTFSKRSTWYSNPFTRGSYSFYSMETEKREASPQILGLPLLDKSGAPVVNFAGEATSPHYFSTVHGAIEAGYREADRILDYRKQSRIGSSKL